MKQQLGNSQVKGQYKGKNSGKGRLLYRRCTSLDKTLGLSTERGNRESNYKSLND